jgi:hypothetical protein
VRKAFDVEFFAFDLKLGYASFGAEGRRRRSFTLGKRSRACGDRQAGVSKRLMGHVEEQGRIDAATEGDHKAPVVFEKNAESGLELLQDSTSLRLYHATVVCAKKRTPLE